MGQVTPYTFDFSLIPPSDGILRNSMLRALLLTLVCRARSRGEALYDMECECGRRDINEIAKMDCEESAKLESAQQGGRASCLTSSSSLQSRS